MVRLTIVGDLQGVVRATLAELGFETGPEFESLYRLALSSFRRRVVPALESQFARSIEQAAARRGMAVLAEVRAIRVRRNPEGELVQLRSSASGPGSERVRLASLENAWNEQLQTVFRDWFQQNCEWILAAVRGENRASQNDWFA